MVSINIYNQKRLESLTIDTIDFAKTIVKETEADLKKSVTYMNKHAIGWTNYLHVTVLFKMQRT